MGHLYHGYVSHNQRVDVKNHPKFGNLNGENDDPASGSSLLEASQESAACGM